MDIVEIKMKADLASALTALVGWGGRSGGRNHAVGPPPDPS